MFRLMEGTPAAGMDWYRIVEIVTMIGTLAVAAIAVRIATKQSALQRQEMDAQREHNVLSVVPYLILNRRGADPNESGLFLKNAGVGPAFIKRISIIDRGASFDGLENSDMIALADQFRSTYGHRWQHQTIGGMAISANEGHWLLKLETEGSIDFRELGERLNETHIEIVYEDVYKRLFRAVFPAM